MPCDPTPFGLWEAEENRLFGGGWEKPWRQDWPQDAPVLPAVGRRRGVCRMVKATLQVVTRNVIIMGTAYLAHKHDT